MIVLFPVGVAMILLGSFLVPIWHVSVWLSAPSAILLLVAGFIVAMIPIVSEGSF